MSPSFNSIQKKKNPSKKKKKLLQLFFLTQRKSTWSTYGGKETRASSFCRAGRRCFSRVISPRFPRFNFFQTLSFFWKLLFSCWLSHSFFASPFNFLLFFSPLFRFANFLIFYFPFFFGSCIASAPSPSLSLPAIVSLQY